MQIEMADPVYGMICYESDIVITKKIIVLLVCVISFWQFNLQSQFVLIICF